MCIAYHYATYQKKKTNSRGRFSDTLCHTHDQHDVSCRRPRSPMHLNSHCYKQFRPHLFSSLKGKITCRGQLRHFSSRPSHDLIKYLVTGDYKFQSKLTGKKRSIVYITRKMYSYKRRLVNSTQKK